jgi:ribonuclease D
VTHLWIDTDQALTDLVERLRHVDRYALDTEFHRERTYFPRLALVQLAWDHDPTISDRADIALIDPLTCDARHLAPLLEGAGLAVLHAAQQDLDVLSHAVGAIPAHLFDTQLAAGFLGYSSPSLVSLLAAELKVQVPKGDRLTDWLRRPLTEDQRSYAASDVAHLFDLQDKLVSQLERRQRIDWARDACEELRTRPVGAAAPEDAWLRLKDARTLKPRARGVARAVTAWRERRAMASDIPPRHVLPDLAILGISQKAPHSERELMHARGVDERHVRGKLGTEILAAVREGAEQHVELPGNDGDELERRLRPAVTLVSAWVSEVARREQIDTTLLATRADLVALLRGDESARLAHGWRNDLLGSDIRKLVDGHSALAFDGRGGMRLIEVPPGA